MRRYPITAPVPALLAGLAALPVLFASTAPAAAQTCAKEAVTSRSENSRFEWTAKSKARANWRLKVRKLPRLGPDYANWAHAANAEERCLSGPSGVVCVLTGTPCKN